MTNQARPWATWRFEVESAPRDALQSTLALLEDVLEPIAHEMWPYRPVLESVVDLLREELALRLAA